MGAAVLAKAALYVAPLWPAGHLPHLGGDWPAALVSPNFDVARLCEALTLPISPLEGEMSGRTEGGAKDRRVADTSVLSP